jgi:hypothetical protein
MTVTWTLRDATGATVDTRLSEVALPAGTQSWWFDGTLPDTTLEDGTLVEGAMLPRGRYTSVVTATDGTLTATQVIGFEIDAFRVKVSDVTPRRRQAITVTVTSAESLATAPRLHVYQPGVARWSVAMTKIATRTYRVTIRMKSGGTGTVTLKVRGRDIGGGVQSTSKAYPLH